LRVDSNDNIYINTYDLNDAANMMDGSIIRMNSSGTITLQKRVNSSNNSYDCFYDKPEVDGAGNMYVTGYSYNGSNYDILALKMNSGGNITSPNGWQERINSSDNQTDYGMRLALDPINGFLYVAALSSNGNNNDLGILELDATTGTVLLNKRINSISNFDDGPYGITVDNNGYVYIAGYSYVDSSNSNILIFKMSPAGVLTAPNGWQMRIVGTSATLTNQMGSYISAGDDGYIYVCGIMKDSAGSHVDTFVMKMNRTQTSNDTIFTNVSSPFTGVSSPFTVTTANYAASNPFTAYSDGNYTILNPGLSFN
jgi:hypothetical protein